MAVRQMRAESALEAVWELAALAVVRHIVAVAARVLERQV